MVMKRQLASLAIALGVVLLSGCGQHGKRLEFNGGEVYYTSSVTEKEAKKLGKYLVDSGFFDGNEKTVQLDKSGDVYQCRMVIKKGYESDSDYLDLTKIFALRLTRDVFNGDKAEVHLCDEYLKTLKVVTNDNQFLEFNGSELLYTSTVTKAEAEKLGQYLVSTGFFDEGEKT